MSTFYDIFIKNLKPDSKILDIGFGSGRDLAYADFNSFSVKTRPLFDGKSNFFLNL